VEQGYKKALEIEPNNIAMKESLSAAEAKIRELVMTRVIGCDIY